MYKSLKKWLKKPIVIKSYLGRSGTGTKSYSEGTTVNCYPVIANKVVVGATGVEVVSTIQLYIEGDVAVTENDLVVLDDDNKVIKAISSYYNKNGSVDIKEVAL